MCVTKEFLHLSNYCHESEILMVQNMVRKRATAGHMNCRLSCLFHKVWFGHLRIVGDLRFV
jgi:hypothetical protein